MPQDAAFTTMPAPRSPERTQFCVVVPAYNEAAGIEAFHQRLAAAMTPLGTWQAVYVNDGSTDATLEVLRRLRLADRRIAVVNLSRNFGKELALTAGLDHADADAVIVIDADLQDPPEAIPDLVAAWREGFDVVYAQRTARDGESWLKCATAAAFYRLMEGLGEVRMPRDTGDFRLMSRRVVEAVRTMREHHRFMKGLFAWVGFPSKAVPYHRAPRHRGATKWNYWKLWNFALEGITGHTVMPLKLASYMGLTVSLLAGLFIAQLIVRTALFGNPVPGYPSLMAVMLFTNGVMLLTVGIMGEYLARIFTETKQRPLYLVESVLPALLPTLPPGPAPNRATRTARVDA